MTSSNAANDFNVAVPQDELDAKPNFLLANGWYGSTIQAGAQVVSNDNGWAGIRIPFSGFTDKAGKTVEKDRNYQITTASSNEQAKSIGRKQMVELAIAFGLAETTTVAGKPAQRLTANSPEEFVAQLNSVAGSPCDVYVTTKKRKRDGQVVMRDDNTGPVMDNEISRVAEFGKGK
jgi:hypothetical protein